MRILLAFIGLFFALSCNERFDADPAQLEGYWEIEKVIMGGEVVKEYQVSTVVDYITLTTDTTGVRKKLAPKLDGTFANTKSAELFSVRMDDKRLYLDYTTPYDSWSEEVVKLNTEELVTQNEQGIAYHYHKYEAKNIFPDD